LLDADADRADLELRLIKLSLEDRARVRSFAGDGGSWRESGHQADAGSTVNHLSLWFFGLTH
jgi:hypothetical protein